MGLDKPVGVSIAPFDQESNEKAGLRETSFCFMSVYFLLVSFWFLVSNTEEGLCRPHLNGSISQ